MRTRIYELSVVPHDGEQEDSTELDTSLLSPETSRLAIHLGFDRDGQPAQHGDIRYEENRIDETIVRQAIKRKYPSWALQPAITKVCRQVREETLPIYYANEFIADSYDYYGRRALNPNRICFPHVIEWLKAIGPENRKLLQTISVQSRGSAKFRWVSGRRFFAIVRKGGIDDIPEGLLKAFIFIRLTAILKEAR